MVASAKVASLWRHQLSRCAPGCEWCREANHTFYEVDVWLRCPFYNVWLRKMEITLGSCLRGRGVEEYFGGLDGSHRAFVRMSSGCPVSLKGLQPMPPGTASVPAPARPRLLKASAGALIATLSLPSVASVISDDINQYHFLIHGEKKIGKTTLMTTEPDVLVLSGDPLRPGLSILQVHCPDWKHWKAYLAKLEEAHRNGNFPYVRVVLDRVDLMYQHCMQDICKEKGIDDPHDAEDFGKTWRALRNEFENTVIRFMSLPCGIWFICHSEWKEKKSKSGVKSERLVPDLANRAEECLNGLVDGWFAYDYVGTERVLYLQGDAMIGAGHALDTHFRTKSGEPIRELPMGDSAAEAWAALLGAFNNETEFADLEARDAAQTAARPTGPKVSLLKKK